MNYESPEVVGSFDADALVNDAEDQPPLCSPFPECLPHL